MLQLPVCLSFLRELGADVDILYFMICVKCIKTDEVIFRLINF